MSALLFAAPLAVIAVISLWMGWKGLIWAFVYWAVCWIALVALASFYVFGGTSPNMLIMTMVAGALLFLVSTFGAGYLAMRARDTKQND